LNEKLVIGLTGMPGSGKSIIVEVAKENGYDVVVMGDEVRKEARKRGLKSTPENLGKIMLELRRTEGEKVIAKRCIPKITALKNKKIIVDGLRSLSEVKEFKKHFPKFTILAVLASPETRFKRLFNRGRSDDPKNWNVFRERDLRELNVGLGNVIALADYVIINENKVDIVKCKVKELLRKIEEKWMK